jgi:UDP-N-acetylglucosamine 1-carboxyvinyltransferase
MSSYLSIKGSAGKRTLDGSIAIVGAKNAALKAIAASILYSSPLELTNVPHIEDVLRMLDILREMGGVVSFDDHRASVDMTGLATAVITPDIAKRLRASIVLTGPMLARMGRVRFPHPGGCVIGERPIDLFLEGFAKMGASVKHAGKFYDIVAPKSGLRGAELFFRVASVTGTETFMMAATLAKGTTVIKNAAMEPEIVWLADILNASGAHIRGAGTPTITIDGGESLSSKKEFRVVPDRIEAGSFLVLGALAAKKLTLTHVVPEHLGSLVEMLRYSGVAIETTEDTITVRAPKSRAPFRSFNVRTHEYPGFPTDLQAPLMIFLTQAKGESLVFETIFEGRLNYTESLARMGANITMMDPHRVLVKGPTKLKGKRLESPDLRAGLAFVIAAAIATGESEIHNVYNIDRGYERVEERLRAIGLSVTRVDEA